MATCISKATASLNRPSPASSHPNGTPSVTRVWPSSSPCPLPRTPTPRWLFTSSAAAANRPSHSGGWRQERRGPRCRPARPQLGLRLRCRFQLPDPASSSSKGPAAVEWWPWTIFDWSVTLVRVRHFERLVQTFRAKIWILAPGRLDPEVVVWSLGTLWVDGRVDSSFGMLNKLNKLT